MIDDIRAIETDATTRIAAAATLDDVRALETELTGKKSPLNGFKKTLGGLDHEQRRAAGQELNRAREVIGEALDAKRTELAVAERRAQIDAERLDLTEFSPSRRR